MMTQRADRRRAALFGGAFLALLLTAAAPAAAQTAQTDPRWQAWLGCWEPAEAAERGAADVPVLCVLPTSDAAVVEIATVGQGEVVARERLAVGERLPSADEGCTGWESATWSADGRRLYRQGEHTCTGGLESRATALMAMLPTGEWLDVQGVTAGEHTGVRVVRYRALDERAVPAELGAALPGRTRIAEAARIAAAAPLGTAEIVEASRHVAPAVVEAWLVEREQGFAVNARQLVELADAGVPTRVIDLMVALSHPRVFAIDRAAREGEFRPVEGATAPDFRRPGVTLGLSPWGYRGYPYGNRHGYGYGYDYPYGYGYRYGGYPVIIVVREPGEVEASQPARAVKGRGYTRGGSSGATPASAPSTTTSPAPPRSRPESASGSSGSASSGSGSGSDSSQPTRTAKPRGSDE